MKRILLAGLSVLSLSAGMATTAVAESRSAPQVVSATSRTAALSPHNLVTIAYQGQLNGQGIPGYGRLLNAHESGQVSAADLVRAAIAVGKLPSEAQSDQVYLQTVNSNLNSLSNG